VGKKFLRSSKNGPVEERVKKKRAALKKTLRTITRAQLTGFGEGNKETLNNFYQGEDPAFLSSQGKTGFGR